ncbi:MAG TPA: glycogen-binding domain-containing protein [Flavisolibacter sp.]|nr:glycogen-binding domain-containing protein [Flavisolibacter sp.]
MEMRQKKHPLVELAGLSLLVLLLLPCLHLQAQGPLQKCTVKEGKMVIEVARGIRESALDSFIAKFDLADLALKEFFKNNNPDSLIKLGWDINVNNERLLIISKPLASFNKIDNPADRIRMTDKHLSAEQLFPAVSQGVVFGYNRFRNKFPFRTVDSIVVFYLRNNQKAGTVMLAGSFNNWDPTALAMTKTDSGWIARVKLRPGKYWYKFVIDGHWTIDDDNLLKENDGKGNTNSVMYRTNKVFYANGFTGAKKVYLSGSFNGWRPRELEMMRSGNGWELPLYLAEGTHMYKFVADGRWFADENNPLKVPDGHNDFNSMLEIGQPYVFRLNGYANAKKVMLAGSFNTWRDFELEMNRTATGWELPYVIGPGNYEYKFKVDGQWISDPANPTQVNNGNSFLIIQPNYTFRLKGNAGAKTVFLAGDFNGWNPNSLPMRRDGNDWVFRVHLSPGKHLYKFIIDGKWVIDPDNKLWEQNEHNTGNSVIWVER